MRLIAAVLLVGSLAIMLLITGCSQTSSAPVARPAGQPATVGSTAPVSVQIASVQRGVLSNTVSYTGNIQARQQVNIIPKVAGRVTKISVEIGSRVKAGDPLLELDTDALAAQAAQANAGLQAAQAKLNGLEAGPRDEQVAQAEANLKSTQARLDQLKAGPTKEQLAVAEAQVRLAKNQLYAVQTQADAYLGSRAVALGQMVFTEEMKNAQAGVSGEQVRVAEAQLALLKAGPTAEQLAQIQAAVDIAQQQLALAKQPVTQYDLQAARAAVAQAKAAADLAKLQLAEATVRAPFSGVVSQRLVSEGAMVGPTSPVLALISADTEVVINVDERVLASLRIGQSATVTANAFPGEVFAATVTVIAPSLDARNRTAQTRLSPQDDEGRLRDGMFAQVQFSASPGRGNTLLVPKSAVVQEQGDSVVYAIGDGRAKRQVVTAGASAGELIEIVSGLTEGQQVAISGLSGLRDGAEVAVQ